MKRVSTATRLSLSLAALTTSVLLAAQSLGLVPDPSQAALQGRKVLCESVAIQCSLAAQRGDVSTIRAGADAIISRNDDVLSVGLRRTGGELLVETPRHRSLWKAAGADKSTANFVQVPIFEDNARWGTMEICFRPLQARGVWGWLAQPVVRLTLFVGCLGFIAYLLYLRKTLRYLDPTSVIPERVKAMLDTLAEGVLVLDRRERIVLANDAFAAMLGRPAGSLQGVSAATLNWTRPHSDDKPESLPWSETIRDGTAHKGFALGLRADAGAPAATANADAAVEGAAAPARLVTVNCSPIVAEKGGPRGVLLTFDDVTQVEATNAQLRETLDALGRSRDEIERQNEELQALATIDPLTGCRNRRSFHTDFQSQWHAAERYAHSLACVMVDVDFFKKINDRHGHGVGDQVLQHVAGILRGLARDSDIVCRYGGEEFCILLPQADVSSACQAAERFRAAIESHSCAGIRVTASVGISARSLGAATPAELLDQADKALYAAKRGGRNRVVRWDEICDAPAAEEIAAAVTPVSDKAHVPIAFHAVTALMSALAHRDRATAEHSQRVADLCAAAAGDLLSVKDRFVLEVAALLHDIGKLGVPDAVLLKPGPLSEAEWTIMRSHDRMGVEIISAAFGSTELTEIVRTHHAQYAGAASSPSLPTGADIPIGARILSLADAYDAMVSDRPYRGARSREAAFEELRRCAGTQFDPGLVERFIVAVIARDEACGPAGLPVADETALRIRLEIERLACAVDAKDMAALVEVARNLVAAVSDERLEVIARQVGELQRIVGQRSDRSEEPDPATLLRLTGELRDLCRAARPSALTQSLRLPDATAA